MDKANIFATLCHHFSEPIKNQLDKIDKNKKADIKGNLVTHLGLIKGVALGGSEKK